MPSLTPVAYAPERPVGQNTGVKPRVSEYNTDNRRKDNTVQACKYIEEKRLEGLARRTKNILTDDTVPDDNKEFLGIWKMNQ